MARCAIVNRMCWTCAAKENVSSNGIRAAIKCTHIRVAWRAGLCRCLQCQDAYAANSRSTFMGRPKWMATLQFSSLKCIAQWTEKKRPSCRTFVRATMLDHLAEWTISYSAYAVRLLSNAKMWPSCAAEGAGGRGGGSARNSKRPTCQLHRLYSHLKLILIYSICEFVFLFSLAASIVLHRPHCILNVLTTLCLGCSPSLRFPLSTTTQQNRNRTPHEYTCTWLFRTQTLSPILLVLLPSLGCKTTATACIFVRDGWHSQWVRASELLHEHTTYYIFRSEQKITS